MVSQLKKWIVIALILQIILVKWLGSHPDWIESYYSNGLYPIVSKFFRYLFGWIPFSLGDILYFLLSILLIRYLVIHRKKIKARPRILFLNIGVVLSVAYFTFHLMWGFNYYRQPLWQKLNLAETHSDEAFLSFVNRLIDKTNSIQLEITSDSTKRVEIPYSQKELFQKTIHGYGILGKKYPFLTYERPSIKKSLFSTALSYMGYGGYLNPFTQEGQVNAKLPHFRFPVVAGHEIGHQLGYSAENETNLIGYLVTAHSEDIYFRYAASAYALGYCLVEIKRRDNKNFESLYARLNAGTQKNYEEMNDFWTRYENPMEPVFKSVFNTFLKANNQAQGIKSYNAVVSLLVTYHQKHPL